ncbi:hypothetical protein LCGC14_0439300 [marine sediment metagenome]|uniref:Uncharacterized protein n=1 Tax=marine sediment metagenome TaxID=412755 RepID=A0A0F9T424_9ZZZZ
MAEEESKVGCLGNPLCNFITPCPACQEKEYMEGDIDDYR